MAVEASGAGPRVAVFGMGNVLMGDDAFGPWVVETFRAEYVLPPEVTARDLGTPGLHLAPFVTGLDALILVDTVKSKGRPGELRTYRREQILAHPPGLRLSPHDPGVKEALLAAELAGSAPREVLLVGAVPGSSALGIGLSPALQAAIRPAVEEVVRELRRLGYAVLRRDPPGRADVWWAAEETA